MLVIAREIGIGQAQNRRLLSFRWRAQAGISRTLKDGLQLRHRLHSAIAGNEASNQPQAPPCLVCDVVLPILQRIAPCIQFRAALQRNPEIGRPASLHTFKAFRRHSHDRDGHIVDEQCLPQYIGIAGKPPRPVVVADHGNGRMVRLVLFAEAAAAQQLHPQARKEGAAYHVAFRLFGFRFIAHGDPAVREWHVGHHGREPAVLMSQRIVDGIGERLRGIDGAGPARRIGSPQVHQPVWIAHRQ